MKTSWRDYDPDFRPDSAVASNKVGSLFQPFPDEPFPDGPSPEILHKAVLVRKSLPGWTGGRRYMKLIESWRVRQWDIGKC
jgi:hypothetical protein